MKFPRGQSLLMGLALLAAAGAARADSVVVGALERNQVQIRAIRQGQIFYEIAGQLRQHELARVTRIQVTNEAPLNAAETAFVAGDWETAADGYLQTLRTTPRDWVKNYAARRLIEAASRTGRYDDLVFGYVQLVRQDSAAALAIQPNLAAAGAGFLEEGARQIDQALAEPQLESPQRQALLQLLVEIHRRRKDAAGLERAVQALSELQSTAGKPAVVEELAAARLREAELAIELGNYAQASGLVHAGEGLWVLPADRVRALWLLAQAAEGQARQSGQTAAMKDAALAYMRVVVFSSSLPASGSPAPGLPERPYMAEALLRTADLLRQAGDPAGARRLYEQVLAEFPDAPAAAKAREAMANSPKF